MDIVDKRVVLLVPPVALVNLAVEFKNEKAKDVVLADLNEEVVKLQKNWDFLVSFKCWQGRRS